jgi:hypothetical protein
MMFLNAGASYGNILKNDQKIANPVEKSKIIPQ